MIVIKSLMKYRLRAKGDFQVDEQAVIIGLTGQLPATLPEAGQTGRNGQGLWLRYPNTDHALLITDAEQAESVWTVLAQDRTATNANGWQQADIDAGEGMVYPGAEDLFLPQVLNYDVTAGVNFKKGCYTGQEVVARLHYRGTPKRRTFLGTVPSSTLCNPGSLVYASDSDKAIGSVVNCAKGADTYHLLLEAVTAAVPQGLHIDSEQGTDVQLEKLPYATTREQDSAQ